MGKRVTSPFAPGDYVVSRGSVGVGWFPAEVIDIQLLYGGYRNRIKVLWLRSQVTEWLSQTELKKASPLQLLAQQSEDR